MQYNRLTGKEKRDFRKTKRLAKAICKLQRENPTMTYLRAFEIANAKLEPPKDKPKPANSKCRDCGAEETIPRHMYTKAARPRCTGCGGQLEYQGGWDGVKDRGRS